MDEELAGSADNAQQQKMRPAGPMRMRPISTRVNSPRTTIPRLSSRSKWQLMWRSLT
jgi:hypothetical protein